MSVAKALCLYLSKFITLLLISILIAASAPVARAQTANKQTNKQQLAAEVRAEFLHAWRGYKKYA